MKQLLFIATLALAPVLTGYPGAAPQQVINQSRRIDSAALLSAARVLSHDSLEGRRVGTAGGVRARAFLAAQFADIGIESLRGTHVHQFAPLRGTDGAGSGPASRVGADSSLAPANVLGVVRGSARGSTYIVISAHYDHLGIRNGEVFNGADDNASGSAALLALARYFRVNRPRHSILFAAFDGEESGLQGARSFVSSPPVGADSIIMNVNMDMIGRNERDELYVTGTLPYPYLRPYVEQVQPRSKVRLLIGHDTVPTGGSRSDNWTSASDHGAFHAARIPFLYFGVEDHPDYHRATDEFERLMPGFYVRAVETILDVVLLLDANGDSIRSQRK